MAKQVQRGGGFIGGTDEFLKFGRGGAGWLSNWKDDGEIVVVLHPATGYWKRNVHPLVVIFERDGAMEARYWPTVCWEPTEKLIQMQYDSEARPTDCPLCRLVYETRDMLDSGAIDADTTVAIFAEGSNKERAVLARDISGDRALTTGQSFRADFSSKMEYVMAVVECAHPDRGVQLTNESRGLGSAVQDAINREIEGCGDEEGNPFVTPWPMKWTYDKKAKQPSKYYSAFRYRKQNLTKEMKEALDGASKKDDCARACSCRNSDLDKLREVLHNAVKIDIDVDALFDQVTEYMGQDEAKEEGKGKDAPKGGAKTPPTRKPPAGKSGGRRPPAKKADKPVWPEDKIPCPYAECGKPIDPEIGDDTPCPHCGRLLTPCGYDADAIANAGEGEDCGRPMAGDDEKVYGNSALCIHCGGNYDGDEGFKQHGCQYDMDCLSPDGWENYGGPKSDAPAKKDGGSEQRKCPACDGEHIPNADQTCPNCGADMAGDDIPF